MGNLWPSLLAGVMALASIFSTQLQGYISHHPALAGVLAALYAVLAHFQPSPLNPSGAR